MKTLKIWGWLLLATSAVLWLYGWINGEFNGHGIAKMDNVALVITIFSIVCALLAITVWVIALAIKKVQADK